MRPRISVIITDLDNTLYDWVEIWYRSFSAMLDRLVEDSGVPRAQLIDEIRAAHQRHGTSEYAFLIEELPSLGARHPGEDLLKKYDAAIHAFRSARKHALRLYPSVLETLKLLKSKGVLIIGYTESMAFYTNYRLRHLGLDGAIDFLYSPRDHDLPKNLTPEQIRLYPSQHYELHSTEHRHTPVGELKPNPRVLQDIIAEVGARPSECLYVGDSLMKDIAMAQAAGVHDAHALYGKAQDRPEYSLLRQVTHWSPEQVEKEKEMLAGPTVTATHTLQASFSEILARFDFLPFSGEVPVNKHLEVLVGIWQKVVDVQQHFNDIEMKIRNAAITVLGALMAAAGYAQKDNVVINLRYVEIPLSVFILFTALVAWAAFYFMDRHWYHRLLYGAVQHGRIVEGRIKTVIPEIELTKTIGDASPFKIFGFRVHSIHKMSIFYGAIAAVIMIVAVFLLVGANS